MGPDLNRDPAFWDAIAQHPEVAPFVFMGIDQVSLAPLVENPRNSPYASENGGVIFSSLDPCGFVVEMHTLYRPEGWGREVAINGKAFVADIMDRQASMIVTNEQEGAWRTRPPKSHGWQVAGPFKDVGLSRRLRLWFLTREAWLASPVGRKMQCP